MTPILIYFFVGIGLSMDAFSLSLSLGILLNSSRRKWFLISFIGLFHFFMPLLGFILGGKIIVMNSNLTNKIVSIIFLLLGIEMLHSNQEEIKNPITTKIGLLFLALLVSLDSLSVGFAYGLKKEFSWYIPIIFSIVSMFYTYLGLWLGRIAQKKYKNKSIILGSIILLFMAIKYWL